MTSITVARALFAPLLALACSAGLLLPVAPAAAVTVLQPGPGLNDGTDQGTAGAGKDAYVIENSPNTPDGDVSLNSVYNSPCSVGRYISLVRFDLGGLPTTVSRVIVSLYANIDHWDCGSALDLDPVWGLHAVNADWNEMTVTWNTMPAMEAGPVASHTFTGTAGVWNLLDQHWAEFDITDLYREWVAGTRTNHGLAVVMENAPCFNCAGSNFIASDELTYTDLRPKLTVSTFELDPIGDKTVSEGAPLSFTLSATGAGGATLGWSSSTLPTGASLDPATGAFSWTPGYDQAGSYPITFTVTTDDAPPLSDSETITVTVNDYAAPVLPSVTSPTLPEGGLLGLDLAVVNPSPGQVLNYWADNIPPGATFDSATGWFSWRPRYDQAGSWNVIFNVHDATSATSDAETVVIQVTDPVPATIFTETFDTPGDLGADPHWWVIYGTWRVNNRGLLSSGVATSAMASVSLFPPDTFPFTAGIIQAKVKMAPVFMGGPNAALLFSVRDSQNYRYVRIKAGKYIIGQVGSIGTSSAGICERGSLPSLQVGRWQNISVRLYNDGRIELYKDTALLGSCDYPGGAEPGGVALLAKKAKAVFDSVTILDDSAIPAR
jgi:hypothetical protein